MKRTLHVTLRNDAGNFMTLVSLYGVTGTIVIDELGVRNGSSYDFQFNYFNGDFQHVYCCNMWQVQVS